MDINSAETPPERRELVFGGYTDEEKRLFRYASLAAIAWSHVPEPLQQGVGQRLLEELDRVARLSR